MNLVVGLKMINDKLIAVNPENVSALVSYGDTDTTELYLHGMDGCFLIKEDYWTLIDKLTVNKESKNKRR